MTITSCEGAESLGKEATSWFHSKGDKISTILQYELRDKIGDQIVKTKIQPTTQLN